MGRLQEMDSKRDLHVIVESLPRYLQTKWQSKVFKFLEEFDTYPGIIQFEAFLSCAASQASDPVFGHISKQTSKPFISKDKPKKSSIFFANDCSKPVPTSRPAIMTNSSVPAKKQPVIPDCTLCDEQHFFSNCKKFINLSQADRFNTCKKAGYCFNCFKPHHRGPDCRNSARCNIQINNQTCRKKHSPLLHQHFVRPDSIVAATTSKASCKTALPVVKVQVEAAGHSITTLALLDSGSTKSFCSTNLLEKLHTTGQRKSLSVTTLSNNSLSEVTEVGLYIRSTQEPSLNPIYLDSVYAIPNFPSMRDSIITPEDISSYQHLNSLELPDTKNEDVNLLIGQDHAVAMFPLEVRKSTDKEPFAIKTPLGWVLYGAPQSGQAISAFSNNIQAGDPLLDIIQRQFTMDNYGTTFDKPQLSIEDQRALDIWHASATLINGHYNLDIPLRHSPPNFPDNKAKALKQLKWIRKKLMADKDLHNQHTSEMNKLFQNGYAEQVSPDAPAGSVWYIPHHNVVNPKKPDKTRIVFNCASTFADSCLNEATLRGPDFTNSLIGVLS